MLGRRRELRHNLNFGIIFIPLLLELGHSHGHAHLSQVLLLFLIRVGDDRVVEHIFQAARLGKVDAEAARDVKKRPCDAGDGLLQNALAPSGVAHQRQAVAAHFDHRPRASGGIGTKRASPGPHGPPGISHSTAQPIPRRKPLTLPHRGFAPPRPATRAPPRPRASMPGCSPRTARRARARENFSPPPTAVAENSGAPRSAFRPCRPARTPARHGPGGPQGAGR